MSSYSDEKAYYCDWKGCGKSFGRRSDLVRHGRIHTNDRPYSCAFCGKAFIQRSALTVHTRVHTGERPHGCEWIGCGKTFSDSSSLARHRRIHTGKRPYVCAHKNCAKSFCRKTTLTKHLRRAHQFPLPLNQMATPSGSEDSENEYDEDDEINRSLPPTPPDSSRRMSEYSLRSSVQDTRSTFQLASDRMPIVEQGMPNLVKVTDVFASTSHGNDDFYARLQPQADYFNYAPEMVRCQSDMGWNPQERPFLTPSEHTIPSQPECYAEDVFMPHMLPGQQFQYQY